MTTTCDLPGVFAALRLILTPYANGLTVVRDAAGTFSLSTKHILSNMKPLFFGGVEVNKRYVSFHLMPLYVFPDLLNSISPALRGRMQGKSCFNFRHVDLALFQELTALAATAHARYVQAGYVAA